MERLFGASECSIRAFEQSSTPLWPRMAGFAIASQHSHKCAPAHAWANMMVVGMHCRMRHAGTARGRRRLGLSWACR